MASITLDDLHVYHMIDREAFTRLVITLMHDPGQSMLVMATWLWLEEIGFPNVITTVISLTNDLVNYMVDEAVVCYNYLASDPPMVLDRGMFITSGIMHRPISLQILYTNRFTAITGIKNILKMVCARIFTDILQDVLRPLYNIPTQPLVIPGFPHPVYGDITVMPRPIDFNFPTGGLWGWNPINCLSEEDRTMFLTFSRGFPVSEEEAKELFTMYYGDCVEAVHTQPNSYPWAQSLFARLVLKSVTVVDKILCGERIAKFKVNGKHVWARKFDRRD